MRRAMDDPCRVERRTYVSMKSAVVRGIYDAWNRKQTERFHIGTNDNVLSRIQINENGVGKPSMDRGVKVHRSIK